MGDFFAFRTLITPRFIQVLFVLGLIGLVLAFIGAAAGDQAVAGLLILVFGTLYWRILCELFFVFFRINDTLSSIKADTKAMAPAPAVGDHQPAALAGASAVTEQPAAAPEGWYDDPDRPGHKRWWDGTAWGARDDEETSSPEPTE